MGSEMPTPTCHMGSRPPRGMRPAVTAKSGRRSSLARSSSFSVWLHAGVGAGQFGAAGLDLFGGRAPRARAGPPAAAVVGIGIRRVMLPEPVQGRDGRPFLGLQGPGCLLQARAFQLGPQQVPLAALAHFVARPGQSLGLLRGRATAVPAAVSGRAGAAGPCSRAGRRPRVPSGRGTGAASERSTLMAATSLRSPRLPGQGNGWVKATL